MRHVFVTFGPQLSSLAFSLTTGPHLDRTTSASVITEPNVVQIRPKCSQSLQKERQNLSRG